MSEVVVVGISSMKRVSQGHFIHITGELEVSEHLVHAVQPLLRFYRKTLDWFILVNDCLEGKGTFEHLPRQEIRYASKPDISAFDEVLFSEEVRRREHVLKRLLLVDLHYRKCTVKFQYDLQLVDKQ